MKRLPDWPERLAAFVDERRAQPFEWGCNDCVTFAADAWLTLTGADPLGPLRGSWTSEDTAAAALRERGGLAAAARRLLAPVATLHSSVWQAPRGAVVCARMAAPGAVRGVPVLGVLLGEVWCAPGHAGLEFRLVSEVRLAWSV